MPIATLNNSPQRQGNGAAMGKATPPKTPDEQRAALRKALIVRPNDPTLKQALLRLTGPQATKHAAKSGVFISYTRADELFALELADDLQAAGVAVWLDILHVSEDGDWYEDVNDALQRCGLLLMVASPDALNDSDIQAQFRLALEAGKIVVPAMHRSCKLDTTMLTEHIVDFRHDYRLGLSILVRLLAS
jgi:hypothetical protein